MFSGIAERACFGPAEISVMQRAMGIAERSLRRDGVTDIDARLRQIALTILQMASRGHSDPLVLSARALHAAEDTALLTFHPYERRPLKRRGHARRFGHILRAQKIA
jgi:hypothetical protein